MCWPMRGKLSRLQGELCRHARMCNFLYLPRCCQLHSPLCRKYCNQFRRQYRSQQTSHLTRHLTSQLTSQVTS